MICWVGRGPWGLAQPALILAPATLATAWVLIQPTTLDKPCLP